MGLAINETPVWCVLGACVLALGLCGCIEELDRLESDADGYFFVDGGVELGASAQTLELGAAGAPEGLDALEVVSATLIDLTDGTRAAYVGSGGEGTYRADMRGVPGHAYQVEVVLAGAFAGTYRSVPDSLGGTLAAADVEAGLRRVTRRGRDGTLDTVGAVEAFVRLRVPEAAARDGEAFVTSSSVSYQLTEFLCGGLDPTETCYLSGDRGEANFTATNLGGLAPGSEVEFASRTYPVDYRFSELAVVALTVQRVSGATALYLRDIGGSVGQSGGIFAERPLTPGGSLRNVETGVAALGNFAVRDEQTFYIPAVADEIREIAPPRPCRVRLPTDGPVGLTDCCDCLGAQGASLTPPPGWP